MPSTRTKSKKPTKKPVVSSPAKPTTRKLKQPIYKPFRLKRGVKHPVKLPSAWRIFKSSVKHLYAHKKLFAAIVLIYIVLSLFFVRGFAFSSDISAIKDAVQEVTTGTAGQLAASLTVFGVLVGSGSPTSDAASVYQSVLICIITLVFIWALRQTHAREHITVKDAFYKSTLPLIPFLLVVLIIGLQLLPMLIGSVVYGLTVSSGLAVTVIEQVLWAGLGLVLSAASIYMVCASIFAMYIVTLPDMTPLRALRSARTLVQYRRWAIIRKVLFLPLIIILIFLGIMLPVILVVTPLSEVIFFVLSAFCLAIAHSYMYSLYRELL